MKQDLARSLMLLNKHAAKWMKACARLPSRVNMAHKTGATLFDKLMGTQRTVFRLLCSYNAIVRELRGTQIVVRQLEQKYRRKAKPVMLSARRYPYLYILMYKLRLKK